MVDSTRLADGGARSGKKTDLAVELAASGPFPVKTVAETLGVAHSNVAKRVKARPKRGAQTREGDLELTAEIRCLVDERPSYCYRRIGASQARSAIPMRLSSDLLNPGLKAERAQSTSLADEGVPCLAAGVDDGLGVGEQP